MGEITYAEPPCSPVASSATELKMAAAITRAVNAPPTVGGGMNLDERNLLSVLPVRRENAMRKNEIADKMNLGSDRGCLKSMLEVLEWQGMVKSERLKQRGAPYIYWRVE